MGATDAPSFGILKDAVGSKTLALQDEKRERGDMLGVTISLPMLQAVDASANILNSQWPIA